jgi:hypothetical protein
MKKLAASALAGLVLVSAALVFPTAAAAMAHTMDECYLDHQECRENALNLDAPWWKVMVILTVCDIALGKCALHL